MAIRKYDEIMELVKNRIGEDTTDEAISFIEDISDTFNDLQTRLTEAGDWKAKYDELDESWRTRYRDRFYETGNLNVDNDPIDFEEKNPDVEDKIVEFEQLFD